MPTPDPDSVPHAGASPEARPPHYKPATADEADRLLDLISELATRVRDCTVMGQGTVAIANGIRAQFMDRWLEEWCAAIEPEPVSDDLRERVESRRNAVRTLMLEKAAVERELASTRDAFVRVSTELANRSTAPAVPLTSGSEGAALADVIPADWVAELREGATPFLRDILNSHESLRTALASARAALTESMDRVNDLLKQISANRAEFAAFVERVNQNNISRNAEVESLQSALDEAKRDTERLDWLLWEQAAHQEDRDTQEQRVRCDWDSGWCINPRDVIDAEIATIAAARSASPVQEQTPAMEPTE